MKKIMTMIMLAVATTAMYANNDKNADVEEATPVNYVINISDNSMARYLYLADEQKGDVNSIHENFMQHMQKAANTANAKKASKIARNAVYSDLYQMRDILTEWQYDRYKAVIYATMDNRGIRL